MSLWITVFVTARRKCRIDLGAPWASISVERNMPSIKFYHDFSAGKNEDFLFVRDVSSWISIQNTHFWQFLTSLFSLLSIGHETLEIGVYGGGTVLGISCLMYDNFCQGICNIVFSRSSQEAFAARSVRNKKITEHEVNPIFVKHLWLKFRVNSIFCIG